jgi:hypothetical protein
MPYFAMIGQKTGKMTENFDSDDTKKEHTHEPPEYTGLQRGNTIKTMQLGTS